MNMATSRVFAVAVSLAAAAGPLAMAAQAQDVIHACYNKSGVLYVIGVPGQPEECRGNDGLLTWSARGSALAFVTATDQLRPPADFTPLLSTQFTSPIDGPVTVSFYANVAQLSGFSNGGLLFRLMVDGTEVVSGNRLRHDFESPDRDAQMIGFDWALNLEAGEHTIAMEWLGLCCFPNTGENATMDSRSLIVRYAN